MVAMTAVSVIAAVVVILSTSAHSEAPSAASLARDCRRTPGRSLDHAEGAEGGEGAQNPARDRGSGLRPLPEPLTE